MAYHVSLKQSFDATNCSAQQAAPVHSYKATIERTVSSTDWGSIVAPFHTAYSTAFSSAIGPTVGLSQLPAVKGALRRTVSASFKATQQETQRTAISEAHV